MKHRNRLLDALALLLLWGLLIYEIWEWRSDTTRPILWGIVCIYFTYLILNPKAYEKREKKIQRNQVFFKQKFGRWWWLVQNGFVVLLLASLIPVLFWPGSITLLVLLISVLASFIWLIGDFIFCYNREQEELLHDKEKESH